MEHFFYPRPSRLASFIKAFAFTLFLFAFSLSSLSQPATFVDPFIGTTNKGNTHPGAVLPWGFASVSPHTVNTPRGAFCYENGAPHIYGFGHVQLSGVGCGDAGNIVIMPFAGDTVSFDPEIRKSSYGREKATAGYYNCYLTDAKVQAEATATMRTGRMRFNFDDPGGGIILDLQMSKSWIKGGYIKKISNNEIEGYQWAGRFCDMPMKRKVFFVMHVVATGVQASLFNAAEKAVTDNVEGTNVSCIFTHTGTKLETKVGISFTSIENARLNLAKEQNDLSFEALQAGAFEKWNLELSKIRIESSDRDAQKKFYTAYYHTLLSPVVFNDVNGEYPSMQTDSTQERFTVKQTNEQYTVYSLWDTYRTVHPFLTLVHPKEQEGMVNSMLNIFRQGGWLPKWELYGQESWVMVGDPSPIVIADSYIKGLRNIDTALAWKAIRKGSLQISPQNFLRPGNAAYWQYGYVPIDRRGGDDSTEFSWSNGYVWGAVSTTLEYQLADNAVGIFANAIGRKKESVQFFKQSGRIDRLFDPKTKVFRPRLANGNFKEPFDVKAREFDIRWKLSGGHGYVEGDAWNYRFFAPHQMKQLIKLYGGQKSFTDTLQRMFDEGHFDMTNEPDITYPYLFNYVKGQEWRTQKIVKECIEKYFTATPGGIPGNDDAGTMSAWLLFSMMGIFPDCPGSPVYQVTIPSFKKITMLLNTDYYKGNSLNISTIGNGNKIRRITWNGKPLSSYSISHNEITKGGNLVIITD